MPAKKKIDIPKLRITEFNEKENRQLNQALAKYVEIYLLKKQGKSISKLYKLPKLNVAGLSKAENRKLNQLFGERLERQVDQLDAAKVSFWGGIVGGIVSGVIGNIAGDIINDIIVDKCSD